MSAYMIRELGLTMDVLRVRAIVPTTTMTMRKPKAQLRIEATWIWRSAVHVKQTRMKRTAGDIAIR